MVDSGLLLWPCLCVFRFCLHTVNSLVYRTTSHFSIVSAVTWARIRGSRLTASLLRGSDASSLPADRRCYSCYSGCDGNDRIFSAHETRFYDLDETRGSIRASGYLMPVEYRYCGFFLNTQTAHVKNKKEQDDKSLVWDITIKQSSINQ